MKTKYNRVVLAAGVWWAMTSTLTADMITPTFSAESEVSAGSVSNPDRYQNSSDALGSQLMISDSMYTGEPSQITESQLVFPYYYTADAATQIGDVSQNVTFPNFHLSAYAAASDSPPTVEALPWQRSPFTI